MIRRMFFLLLDDQPFFSLVLVVSLFVPSLSFLYLPSFLVQLQMLSPLGILFFISLFIPLVTLIIFRRGKEILILRCYGLSSPQILSSLLPHFVFVALIHTLLIYFFLRGFSFWVYGNIFLIAVAILLLSHVPASIVPRKFLYSFLKKL